MARPSVRGTAASYAALLTALLIATPAEAAGLSSQIADRAGPADAVQAVVREPSRPPVVPGDLTPNQLFAGRTLTPEQAQAACGPAAAVAFAKARGQSISLDAAVAVAKQVGWTAEYGMAGPASQVSLLARLGVPATLQAGIDRARIARELQAGRPVIIRTGGSGSHYFVAERYDAANDRFDLGQSALVLRSAAGRRWFSLDEIARLGVGTPTHAIFMADARPAPAAPEPVRAASVGSRPLPTASAPAQVPAGARARVVDTGGPNARLRAEPGLTARVVGAAADGTRLTDLGATATASGRLWRRVMTAGGTTAWVDAGLLSP